MKQNSENVPLSMLKLVSNQLDRCRNMDFERLQLTSSQANVMLYLFAHKRKDVSHQDIQSSLHLSHPTITGLMQRLEQKGFIERHVNPLDNRCKYVKLTIKGEKLEKKLKANSKTMEQAALAEVSPQQLEVFNATLGIISRNLSRKSSNFRYDETEVEQDVADDQEIVANANMVAAEHGAEHSVIAQSQEAENEPESTAA